MAGRPKTRAARVGKMETQAVQLLATMIRSIPDRCVKLDKAMQAGDYVSRGSQDELTMAWIQAYRSVKDVAAALKRLGDEARDRAGIEGGGPWEAIAETASPSSVPPDVSEEAADESPTPIALNHTPPDVASRH